MIEDVFLDFFRTLESRGIRAAVLHSHEKFPERITSDVDFSVEASGWGRLVEIQNEVALRHGWVVAQVLRHETTACYTVLINPKSPDQFLKLDACTDYVCKGRRFIPGRTLLAGRIESRGFFVAAPEVECVYRLVKAVHKAKDPGEVLAVIRELHRVSSHNADKIFSEIVRSAKSLSEWLAEGPAGWPALSVEVAQSGTRHRRFEELLRRFRRMRSPTGIRLSLLGPDGSGKGTLLANLREMLEPCFRHQAVFHFRPRAFEKPGDQAPVTQPHAQEPRSRAAGWAKVLYYFADHALGHWVRIRPALVRSTLVVFDRDFSDLVSDPVRFRLRGTGLASELAKFVPHSDVTLILDASPSVLHARKPELSMEELGRQRAVFAAMSKSTSSAHLLNAELPPQEIAKRAAELVLATLSKRTARRENLPLVAGGADPAACEFQNS